MKPLNLGITSSDVVNEAERIDFPWFLTWSSDRTPFFLHFLATNLYNIATFFFATLLKVAWLGIFYFWLIWLWRSQLFGGQQVAQRIYCTLNLEGAEWEKGFFLSDGQKYKSPFLPDQYVFFSLCVWWRQTGRSWIFLGGLLDKLCVVETCLSCSSCFPKLSIVSASGPVSCIFYVLQLSLTSCISFQTESSAL